MNKDYISRIFTPNIHQVAKSERNRNGSKKVTNTQLSNFNLSKKEHKVKRYDRHNNRSANPRVKDKSQKVTNISSLTKTSDTLVSQETRGEVTDCAGGSLNKTKFLKEDTNIISAASQSEPTSNNKLNEPESFVTSERTVRALWGEAETNGSDKETNVSCIQKEEEDDSSSCYMNFEDLLTIEEKLYETLNCSRTGKLSKSIIFEWWTLNNCSCLFGKHHQLFISDVAKKTVRNSVVFEMTIMLMTYLLLGRLKNFNSAALNSIKNLIYILHQNYLIICDYFVSKISADSYSNVWVNKIQNLILTKLNKRLKKGENVALLNKNNENILLGVKHILKICANSKIDFGRVKFFIKNFSKINLNSVNLYLRSLLMKDGFSCVIEEVRERIEAEENFPSMEVPYLNREIKEGKALTLVLDLDETLIHFKMDSETGKGSLRLRPYLMDFLAEMKKLFELVLFTAATQDVII